MKLMRQLMRTIRPILNNKAIIDSSSVYFLDPLKPLCLTDQVYFNFTLKKCIACPNGCSLCDTETAVCISCAKRYFMKDSQCFKYKYTALGQENYEVCFEAN